MSPSSVEGAAPQDCSRASSLCTDSFGVLIPLCLPALTSPFSLPYFSFWPLFCALRSRVFPMERKSLAFPSLSYTVCPPGITSPITSLAVFGHTGTSSSEGILQSPLPSPASTWGRRGLCTPCSHCHVPILVLPFCSWSQARQRQCAGAFCLRGVRGGEREKGC